MCRCVILPTGNLEHVVAKIFPTSFLLFDQHHVLPEPRYSLLSRHCLSVGFLQAQLRQVHPRPTLANSSYFGHDLLWPRPTLATTYFGQDLLWPRPGPTKIGQAMAKLKVVAKVGLVVAKVGLAKVGRGQSGSTLTCFPGSRRNYLVHWLSGHRYLGIS